MREITTKKFLLGGLIASSLFLVGCLADEQDNSLKITSHPLSLEAAVGDSISFSVSVKGTGPFTYRWVVNYSSKSDTLSYNTSTIGFRAFGALSGTSIEVTVNNATEIETSNRARVTLTYGAGDTVSLGAQSNVTVGSVLDLDSCKIWSLTAANDYQSRIDLVYMYYNGMATLNGASAARDSGRKYAIGIADTYDSLQMKDIQFVSVPTMPVDLFASERAFTAGSKLRSTPIMSGDKFVVRSTEGTYHYLEVRRIAGTASGSATLKLFLGEIWD